MDKRQELCEYLKKYHTGKEKAFHSKELQKILMPETGQSDITSTVSDWMAYRYAVM